MDISEDKILQLKKLIDAPPRNMVIVTHANPDGDAIGASLAWGTILERRGHTVSYIVPNRYPSFLNWMPGISKLTIYREKPSQARRAAEAADVVFCLDFNQIQRLEGLGEAFAKNDKATYALIDHHLDPPPGFDIEISHPESSSTAFLVYCLIEKIAGLEAIDKPMAEQIYVGIMTDTGNFSFSHLTAELFRAVAVLIEKGIDIPYINRMVYHSFKAERLRLLGFSLSKMETVEACGEKATYITLTEEELRRFRFQVGDSEGFVNYPLSIRDMAMSAIFIQTREFIRISLRSRIDVDASEFARRYFEGGGHKNASGGKSYLTMEETVEKYKAAVQEFFCGEGAE